MPDLVTIARKDGVADVRLNRPEKYNALSPEMFAAITEAGESLMRASDIRAVVLSGNGRGFCSGLDFSGFSAMAGEMASEEGRGLDRAGAILPKAGGPENFAQRPALVWKQLPVPVIAAIHGVAFGGGCQIALGADIRIARGDARLSIMEIKWGLVPDMSITQTLRDLVPLDVAKELMFTGRIVSGVDAAALGLVTRTADNPLAQALTLAREIASRSPDAVRAGKRLLEQSWRADPAVGLGLEAKLQGGLIGTPNQVEAVKANFENRSPEFEDAS